MCLLRAVEDFLLFFYRSCHHSHTHSNHSAIQDERDLYGAIKYNIFDNNLVIHKMFKQQMFFTPCLSCVKYPKSRVKYLVSHFRCQAEDVRGCSPIMSAKNGGFPTPPPSFVSQCQHFPQPPLPSLSASVSISPTSSPFVIYCSKV